MLGELLMPVKRLSYPHRVSCWKCRSWGRRRGTYHPEVCNVERARVVGVSVGWDEERDWASSDHAKGESRGGNEDCGELHFEFGGGGGGW